MDPPELELVANPAAPMDLRDPELELVANPSPPWPPPLLPSSRAQLIGAEQGGTLAYGGM
jgi:hypothetical protein